MHEYNEKSLKTDLLCRIMVPSEISNLFSMNYVKTSGLFGMVSPRCHAWKIRAFYLLLHCLLAYTTDKYVKWSKNK